MSAIETYCNEGCQQPFAIEEMPTVKLDNDIEKTYFACKHCQHEYVAFYTDIEIRSLQDKMRKILGRTVNPQILHTSIVKQERKKMDALRKQVEITKSGS